jgi:hypothetical protein
MRPRKLGAIAKLLRPVVVEPVLTGFVALNDGMRRRVIMRGRMLAGRHVAATDVTALRTSPKMQPPTAVLKTFDATIAARYNGRVNAGIAVSIGHAISPKWCVDVFSVMLPRPSRRLVAALNYVYH